MNKKHAIAVLIIILLLIGGILANAHRQAASDSSFKEQRTVPETIQGPLKTNI